MNTSPITLDQEQMKFLLQMLSYIVVAAPHRNWAQRKEIDRVNPNWNPIRFQRDRVWKFLKETLAEKDICLKDGKLEHLLILAKQSLNTDPSSTTYEVSSVFTDDIILQTYNRNPYMTRACIESIAAVLLSHNLSYFGNILCVPAEELVCGQTFPGDTARAPEQPGPLDKSSKHYRS